MNNMLAIQLDYYDCIIKNITQKFNVFLRLYCQYEHYDILYLQSFSISKVEQQNNDLKSVLGRRSR